MNSNDAVGRSERSTSENERVPVSDNVLVSFKAPAKFPLVILGASLTARTINAVVSVTESDNIAVAPSEKIERALIWIE